MLNLEHTVYRPDKNCFLVFFTPKLKGEDFGVIVGVRHTPKGYKVFMDMDAYLSLIEVPLDIGLEYHRICVDICLKAYDIEDLLKGAKPSSIQRILESWAKEVDTFLCEKYDYLCHEDNKG